jgi:hypothetical protein
MLREVGIRRLASVEEQIEVTRIHGKITPEQPVRLEPDAPGWAANSSAKACS